MGDAGVGVGSSRASAGRSDPLPDPGRPARWGELPRPARHRARADPLERVQPPGLPARLRSGRGHLSGPSGALRAGGCAPGPRAGRAGAGGARGGPRPALRGRRPAGRGDGDRRGAGGLMAEDPGRWLDPSAAAAPEKDGCPDGCGAPTAATGSVPLSAERRGLVSRRVRLLVAATIGYNLVEAVVALAAGTVADSTALIGFGLDSVIEVASAAAVAWQFSGRDPQARERTALRVIAVSFFALALYVAVESARSVFGGQVAEHSTVGIVLAAVSLLVMPVLSYAQRRAGRELGSASAVADSKQTLLCTYLSGVLLVGLVLNAAFGWSRADPIVALVIAAVAVREGRHAWRGEHCC